MSRIFHLLTEAIGFLQIAASLFVIGMGLGAVLYFTLPQPLGLVLGILAALAGLSFGIFWATKAWKGKGTVWLLSRRRATPELDAPEA